VNFNVNFRTFSSSINSAFVGECALSCRTVTCRNCLGSNGYVLDLILDILKKLLSRILNKYLFRSVVESILYFSIIFINISRSNIGDRYIYPTLRKSPCQCICMEKNIKYTSVIHSINSMAFISKNKNVFSWFSTCERIDMKNRRESRKNLLSLLQC